MSDEDRSTFYTDRLTGTSWEYASSLIDDAFQRLQVTLEGLRTALVTVFSNGSVVGQRGTLEFRGNIVQVAEDVGGDRIVITLPDYGVPVGLGDANAAGALATLPRSDHVHKRDVRVKLAGVDIGTRNAINFIGLTAVDNPGADTVDVTGSEGLVPLTTVLMGEPEFVWDDDLNLVMAEEG